MPKSDYFYLSGREVIKVLCKHFGFIVASQKGSHVKLKNNSKVTIVPDHKELAYGTFKSILNMAEIREEDFYNFF